MLHHLPKIHYPQHPKYADNVFLVGDAASGASLVVRAIASGRKVAEQIDAYVNGVKK